MGVYLISGGASSACVFSDILLGPGGIGVGELEEFGGEEPSPVIHSVGDGFAAYLAFIDQVIYLGAGIGLSQCGGASFVGDYCVGRFFGYIP